MKKTSLLSIFIFFVQFSIAQEQGLQQLLIAENKLSIQVPASFTTVEKVEGNWNLMNNLSLGVTLLYEYNNSKDVHPVSDNDITQWADKQLDILKQNKTVEILNDDIFLQDGKNISYIKYIHKDGRKKNYSMLFFISVDDKPVQFSFTCPLKSRKKWEPVVDAIANSLRLVP